MREDFDHIFLFDTKTSWWLMAGRRTNERNSNSFRDFTRGKNIRDCNDTLPVHQSAWLYHEERRDKKIAIRDKRKISGNAGGRGGPVHSPAQTSSALPAGPCLALIPSPSCAATPTTPDTRPQIADDEDTGECCRCLVSIRGQCWSESWLLLTYSCVHWSIQLWLNIVRRNASLRIWKERID